MSTSLPLSQLAAESCGFLPELIYIVIMKRTLAVFANVLVAI